MSVSARRLQRAQYITTPSADRGPVSFTSIAAAQAFLSTPPDANYVLWNPIWPVDRDLEDVFATELDANDILVLPERPEPYIIDSSEGFRASGVQSVTGRNGQIPIVNRYHDVRNARTWFAMARARRGILGLGPNAVIKLSQSSWTQEPQIEDKDSVQSDGWVSPGRYWTNTSGVVQYELVGCQEKIIEAAHASPYFGNFSLRAHDLGGVAFSGIACTGSSQQYERLDISNGWRGFMGVPNGEAAALSTNGGTYQISRCILGTRDDIGVRVGSSPIMINSSTGGTIEETDACESRAGMLTIWNSSGTHVLTNVACKFNWDSPGINFEKCQSGFTLDWNGGAIWSDYNGGGGKTPKPSDQADRGGLHIGLFSEVGSAKITLRGVDLDIGPTPGALNIQSYGASQQNSADIECYATDNSSIPIQLYA